MKICIGTHFPHIWKQWGKPRGIISCCTLEEPLCLQSREAILLNHVQREQKLPRCHKRKERKKKNSTLKTLKEAAPNWVIGATCIQFASAFVVMKTNMFPWRCSSIAGRTEVCSLAMKPYMPGPINHTDDEIRREKDATEQKHKRAAAITASWLEFASGWIKTKYSLLHG